MKVDYKNDIESVLLSEEKLKEIVTSLGKQIRDRDVTGVQTCALPI